MAVEAPSLIIRPQPGPQETFLATSADIAVFGGAAGGGKSYALLIEPLRHIKVRGFGGVIFRRTYPEIMNEGGLWDTSMELYPHLGASPKQSISSWTFPGNVNIKFAHMQHEKDRLTWQGSQIPFIGFDELTHFSWKQFTYLLSRNRSICGIRPYIRATTNPDPDHFLRTFIEWWIDDESGFHIPERGGIIRWFTLRGDNTYWADHPVELVEELGCSCSRDVIVSYLNRTGQAPPALCLKCEKPTVLPKSFTFVPSSIYDNKMLLDQNPEYLANLQALPKVDRGRLLDGNWNIRESAGMFFERTWFPFVNAAPNGSSIRYWDRAATEANGENDPSYTAGLKMTRSPSGDYFIEDVIRFRGSPLKVEQTIKNTASQDGKNCIIGLEQDPGQAGKVEAQMLAKKLAGYRVKINVVRESKGTRAKPYSAQAEAGNIHVVRGLWNEIYLREHENFDGTDKGHADQVDAGSGAFYLLTSKKRAGAVRRR